MEVLLEQTLSLARLTQITICPINPPISWRSVPPPPQWSLHIPSLVQTELNDTGIPLSLRNALADAIAQLQKRYLQAFQKAHQETMSIPGPPLPGVHNLGNLLQGMFTNQALPDVMKSYSDAKEAIFARRRAEWESRRRAEEQDRTQFNANHTPLLLIIYTHHTPYPTVAERLAIAEYTHMSERQIEVWFQNHRRVQKKAGFPPSRARGLVGGIEALLASLPSSSYSQPTPEPERHPDEDPEKKYLSLTRPAFPYPPSSDVIPVPAPPPNPKGKGKEVLPSFLRPVPYPAHSFHFDVPWPRAATSTAAVTTKPPPPTMDALTEMFAHMNVHSPAQDHEGEAATARYTTDLRARSAAYVGEGAWKSWSWSWHGRTGLLSVEWQENSWETRRKTAKRASWKPYSKPQQLPRRTPSSSPSRRVPSSSSSSSSSSSRVPSWGSQTEAPHSPASSYTSYSPSPSPPPGFVLVT
ncbi:hypothetical protein IW262DRAFT_99262 [Armillaria fumosa]|nr:hypothetical protein IW262DRAFT_99262 [Armillaria fumosa]